MAHQMVVLAYSNPTFKHLRRSKQPTRSEIAKIVRFDGDEKYSWQDVALSHRVHLHAKGNEVPGIIFVIQCSYDLNCNVFHFQVDVENDIQSE